MRKDLYRSRYSAGILPYTFYDGKLYFLLGKERQTQQWCDFGGHCEKVDKGVIEYTAAREFFEETMGAILDIKVITRMLFNTPQTHIVKTVSNIGHPYTMYIVRIPYKYYRNIFLKILNFLRYTKTHRKFTEKDDIQWVSVETLLKCCQKTYIDDNLDMRVSFSKAIRENEHYLTQLIPKALPPGFSNWHNDIWKKSHFQSTNP